MGCVRGVEGRWRKGGGTAGHVNGVRARGGLGDAARHAEGVKEKGKGVGKCNGACGRGKGRREGGREVQRDMWKE